MARGLVLIALFASLGGCERSVRAVPLADEVAVAPLPGAVFDLLTIDVPAGVERTDRGSEVTFAWPDRSISLRELGDVQIAGRRADYTAEIAIANEAPLLCRLGEHEGAPELVGDVVLCGRTFEVRCRGGEAPAVGVSGFWCLSHLTTIAVDRGSIRGAECATSQAADVAQAPEDLRRTAEALSLARAVRVDAGAIELSTQRACDVARGADLTVYASDGEAQTVPVIATTRSADRCDVRVRVASVPGDHGRSLWLVGPAVATRAHRAPPPPPLPTIDDLDESWGRLRHEFDLDRDGTVDAIVRSGDGNERLLILDVDAARWYLREPAVG